MRVVASGYGSLVGLYAIAYRRVLRRTQIRPSTRSWDPRARHHEQDVRSDPATCLSETAAEQTQIRQSTPESRFGFQVKSLNPFTLFPFRSETKQSQHVRHRGRSFPPPSTLHPQLYTLNPTPSTINHQPSTHDPQPSTLKSQLSTLNTRPCTPEVPSRILPARSSSAASNTELLPELKRPPPPAHLPGQWLQCLARHWSHWLAVACRKNVSFSEE